MPQHSGPPGQQAGVPAPLEHSAPSRYVSVGRCAAHSLKPASRPDPPLPCAPAPDPGPPESAPRRTPTPVNCHQIAHVRLRLPRPPFLCPPVQPPHVPDAPPRPASSFSTLRAHKSTAARPCRVALAGAARWGHGRRLRGRRRQPDHRRHDRTSPACRASRRRPSRSWRRRWRACWATWAPTRSRPACSPRASSPASSRRRRRARGSCTSAAWWSTRCSSPRRARCSSRRARWGGSRAGSSRSLRWCRPPR